MLFLDTDIIIDILRDYPPAIEWLKSSGKEEIIISGFVAMELIQGCRNKQEQDKIEKKLLNYTLVWPSENTYKEAFQLFLSYHLSYNTGILDVIIGQMAVELKLPLHTFNQKHYSVVPGLKTIQPYKKM